MQVAVLELPAERAWGVQLDGVRIAGVVRYVPEPNGWIVFTPYEGDWEESTWQSREAAAMFLLVLHFEHERARIAAKEQDEVIERGG